MFILAMSHYYHVCLPKVLIELLSNSFLRSFGSVLVVIVVLLVTGLGVSGIFYVSPMSPAPYCLIHAILGINF